jgi:hypothetical protein
MTAPAMKLKVLLAALLLAQAGGGLASEMALPDFNLNSTGLTAVGKLSAAQVPPVPPPTDTGYYPRYGAGAARMETSVTVVVQDGAGRADILFPRTGGSELSAGYRSALFIKLEGEGAPVLSWATVFCSGGHYLGYKGARLELPRGSGAEFLMKDETLALGPLKVRLLRTHPWMADVPNLDSLCSAGLAFKYDRAKNSLTVTWK